MRIVLLACTAMLWPAGVDAAWTGQVRSAGPDPSPGAGVAVTDGTRIVRTDAAGRYTLPEGDGAWVQITCPDDYACPDWYREGGGDFVIQPDPSANDFFFVQLSDAHVFGDPEDFQRFSAPPFPSWLPYAVTDWLTLQFLDSGYPELDRDQIVEALRQAVAPYRDVADLGDRGVYRAYAEAMAAGEIPMTQARARFVEAIAEVAGLEPAFVLSTGDLWLESNTATPEAIERWRDLYRDTTEQSGVRFYNTIGNNEIAGFENPDFLPEDPRYGKFYFRDTYGPTAYSFDRGPFHFVALDTHRPKPTDEEPKAWTFGEMEPEIRAWADADLEAHADRVLVAVNHEPFHYDESWDFDEPRVADDAGLFEKHGVAYSLAGHTHRNGFQSGPGTTTHITTGALSGLRWVLPPAVHPRGYRLFRAQNGKLYSAWKNLGQPAVGFVTPTDPKAVRALHPASAEPAGPRRLAGTVQIVVVAADVAGPFSELQLELDGEPLPLEMWGNYFAATSIDADQLPRSGGQLRLTAARAEGPEFRSELHIQAGP